MGDPEDESLSEWAHRRAARLRPVGERRAVTLGMGRLSAAARYHRGQLRRRATPPERPPDLASGAGQDAAYPFTDGARDRPPP